MGDVWPLVERWNAARLKAWEARNMTILDLLDLHAPWVLESIGLRFVCDTCEADWPCVVFVEIEAVL